MKCAECDGKCLEGGTLCSECQQALKGPNGSQSQTDGTKPLELDTNEPNPLSSGLSEDAPAERDPGPGLQPPAGSAEAAIEEHKVGATDRATGEAETEEQKEGKTLDSRGSGSLEPEINEGNEENEGKPESPGLLKDVLSGQESGPGSQLQPKTEGHEDTSSDSNLAESGRGDDPQLQDDDSWVVVPDSAEQRTSEPNQDQAHPLSSGRASGPGSQLQCRAAGETDEGLVLSPRQEIRIQQVPGHQLPVKLERDNLTGSASQAKGVETSLASKHSDQQHLLSKPQVPGSAVREEPMELQVNPYAADPKGNEETSASKESILSENPYFSSTSSSVEDMMTLEFVAVWPAHFKLNELFDKIAVLAYSHPGRYQEFARMQIRYKNNYRLLTVGQAKIPLSALQSGQPIYYKYGVIDTYTYPRRIQLEHIYKTVQKNEKAESHRVLTVPDSAIRAGGKNHI
ncbi:hypothetical protein KIL84_007212 [Mauremys mutica]|uniref:Uncharacterized protein n=1 Tax=Mauremys mutica TaxID=74926 RepID=A0A9D3WWZ6_9SAUR|nr:hypothetical protein KIL84_007212 [Mauremys mutica]